MASPGHRTDCVLAEEKPPVFQPDSPVRVWQPEYAPEPVTGQLLEFGSRGPRVLMERMVVMDRSRALHLEFPDSGVQMQIAGQHCSLRSDPQGRGWLLVCDCVPWIPEQIVRSPSREESCPWEQEQVVLRWEGMPQENQAAPLLARTRQGICFGMSSPPEPGRRLACQLPPDDSAAPLIAQVQWYLRLDSGRGCAGAEFLPGQHVDHLPEQASPPAERADEEEKKLSAQWWSIAGVLLMIAALWFLLGL